MKRNYLLGLMIGLLMGMEATAQTHFTERDTIDVLHYNICLDMGHRQPAHMHGWCELSVRMLQPSNNVAVGLMYATIDSVELDGSPLNNGAYSYNNKRLRVQVGNRAVGDTVRLKVHYGTDGWVGRDGGFWCSPNLFYNLGEDRFTRPFSMGRSWYPCNDSVYDRATYSFHMTVNNGWTAVCSGELTDVVTNADRSLTFHYELQHPVSTYHVGCNAARYRVYRFNAEGLYGTYPVQASCLAKDSATVAEYFRYFNRTLQLYERHFGPYVWENIRFTEGGENAGMEHVNDICISYDYPNMTYLLDHEFAHQWFGNQVTCARIDDMWFNEGGATFADQMATVDHTGNNNTVKSYKRIAILNIPQDEGGYHPLCGMPHQYSFMSNTYYKGAMVFRELKQLLGDSIFYAMIRTLLDRNKYTNMDSYQLRDSMSLYCGVDLTDFYDFHIFHGGFASYGVDSLRTYGDSTHVWLSQKRWHAPDYCRLARVPVTFFSAEGDTLTGTVMSRGQHSEGVFALPFTPTFAIVDYHSNLASANFCESFNLSSRELTESEETQMRITPTQVNGNVQMHVALQLGKPEEEPIPGVVRWDYRRWTINGDYGNDFMATIGFYVGNRYPVYDQEFCTTSSSSDSLRLFYREDGSQPWQLCPRTTIEQGQIGQWNRVTFVQMKGRPRKGEYALAVVDANRLGIDEGGNEALSSQLGMTLSPNPAEKFVTVTLDAQGRDAGKSRVTVVNAAGKAVAAIELDGTTAAIETATWPAGIYFVTITTTTGSVTKKLIVQ